MGQGNGGYGPVANDQGPLLLPQGFHVQAFGGIGDPMSDGSPTPIAHDGMACFAHGPNRFRLVRNHEDRNDPPVTPIGSDPYDPVAGAGTTTLEVGRDRELLSSWVSLSYEEGEDAPEERTGVDSHSRIFLLGSSPDSESRAMAIGVRKIESRGAALGNEPVTVV